MIGQRLLHYEVTEKLGEGGMGVVYKARDTHLDRFVAIKVLPPARVADPTRKARFIQEAKAASALNHPNIVTIHDIGADAGVDFIAMEFVAGKPLDQLIPHRGLRLNETLKYAIQIAEALAAAHTAGIIHRDLKPSNVMAAGDGRIKILDFGLAKLTVAQASACEDLPTRTAGPETTEGAVIGTASYMSPEQAEGKKVDARSDIFSFGSMLYEMATGRKPFQGDSKMSVLASILHHDPKPAGAVSPEVPRDLERIISRCLRKELDRRFQTMGDLRAALLELKEESDSGRLAGSPAHVAPRRTRGPVVWISAAALVLLAAAGGWYLLRQATRPRPGLKAVPLTTMPGTEQLPSLSPDGNLVAYSWDGPNFDNTDIYVQQIGGGAPLRLTTDPAAEICPAWSPDGRFIAFGRSVKTGSEILRVPSLGGPEQRMGVSTSGSPCVSWSPDGRSLVISDRASPSEPFVLFLHSLDSGQRRKLISPPAGSWGDSFGRISPDGRWLLFVRDEAYFTGDLYRIPLADNYVPRGEPERLTSDRTIVSDAAWMPDSRDVLFASLRDGATSAWRLTAGSRAAPERLPAGADVASLAVSLRGNRLVLSQGRTDTNIWRLDLQPGRTEAWIVSTARDLSPAYSPDGRRIAFVSSRSGTPEIWVADADGKNAVEMPATGRRGPGVAWSPDGSRLAVTANVRGQWGVFTLSMQGGAPERLTTGLDTSAGASWSRDGRWLYVSALTDVWKVPVGGGKATQITRQGGYGPIESRDGKFLYYVKRYGGPGGLWRVPAAGGDEIELIPDLRSWACFEVAPDGIYYIPTGGPGNYAIRFLDLATGKTRQVAVLPKPPAWGLSLSPDGRHLLYSQTDQTGSDLVLVENFR
jgi:serine/threonine protein kinase